LERDNIGHTKLPEAWFHARSISSFSFSLLLPMSTVVFSPPFPLIEQPDLICSLLLLF
jgi:hypothetical protein